METLVDVNGDFLGMINDYGMIISKNLLKERFIEGEPSQPYPNKPRRTLFNNKKE